MNEKKILHLHLPKTGGTAFRHFLTTQLGEDRVFWPQRTMMLSEAILQWPEIQVISGHFSVRQGDTLPHERLSITVLRNPIERFISEFQYNKYDLDNHILDAKQRAFDLDEYIEHASGEISTIQMEMLFPLGTDLQRRLTVDEKLKASMAAIDSFDMVGIQENLEDLSCMLGALMDWEFKPIERKNVTSRRLEIDMLNSAQKISINKLLEAEIDLYEYVKSRFKCDRQKFIRGIRPQVATQKEVSQAEPWQNANIRPIAPKKIEAKDFGDLRAEIVSVEVIGQISGAGQVMTGESMEIVIHLIAHVNVDQINIGVAIKNEQGLLIFGTNSLLLGIIYELTPGKYTAKFTMLNRIGPGRFTLDAALTCTESHYDECFHWRRDVTEFIVHAYATQHFDGRILMDAEVQFNSESAEGDWKLKQASPINNSARAFGQTPVPLTEYLSTIEVMTDVELLGAGVDAIIQVKLTNTGNEIWFSNGRLPIHLSYRWYATNGDGLVMDGLRTNLPSDISPGGSVITPLHIRTPRETGRLTLAISLVQEQVAWFMDKNQGACCILPITLK